MQSNLKSLFAGKREAVELPPKRGPGRPPKKKEVEEQPDELAEALREIPDQPEAYDEHLRMRHRKRKFEDTIQDEVVEQPMMTALVEASGQTVAQLKMPGDVRRDSVHEGPQMKLRLCKWARKTHEAMGGTHGDLDIVVSAIAERWGMTEAEIRKILGQEGKWKEQCEERGVNEHGLKRDEAHLPRFLRKSVRGKGKVTRAKGAGRKDKLRFLYPIVKDFFETMRVHGKYIDAVDLEEYLQHTMQRYLDEGDKPEVKEAVKDTKLEKNLEVVKKELARLRDPKTTKWTHENRQNQLMRFCGARLRTPQRLTTLTVKQERARWMTTLQGYDRLLWEAMRPEFLQEKVIDPEAFVAGLEDTVVIHADQVPCWLSVGSQKQLYGNAEIKRRKKAHEDRGPNMAQPGGQVQHIEDDDGMDGMAQMRQHAKGEADRFRVTVELAQVVTNVFKPSEKPEVRHAKPVMVVPGAHGRLSNIDRQGLFIEDEIVIVKGKQKVRKAGTSAGNLMLPWRKLRDEGPDDIRAFFNEIEVMQQTNAFCDGIIIAWIAEMRKKEGYSQVISVRDMFAGGLSASCKRMSITCSQLLTFIAGKMTPVMQLTDTAVAFELKKLIEACKAEIRREKRGQVDFEAAFLEAGEEETACGAAELMRVVGRSMKRLREKDENQEPERLLKASRSAGWLSYRADPVSKKLIRCDEEDWMKGRKDELPEKSHRHPSEWWNERYNWIDEHGEPRKPDYKSCGKGVEGVEYMRDEFPEQKPNEMTRLHCLRGQKQITLPCFDLTGEDECLSFPEVAKNLVPSEFLKTQREKFEAARLRALVSANGEKQSKKTRRGPEKIDKKIVRAKTKRRLVRHKANKMLREYLAELRSRAAEGYSVRQLIKSHIPEIGGEIKVSDAEVTAAMQKREVKILKSARPNNFLLTRCHY